MDRDWLTRVELREEIVLRFEFCYKVKCLCTLKIETRYADPSVYSSILSLEDLRWFRGALYI